MVVPRFKASFLPLPSISISVLALTLAVSPWFRSSVHFSSALANLRLASARFFWLLLPVGRMDHIGFKSIRVEAETMTQDERAWKKHN